MFFRVLSFTSSIQIVKTVSRKQAASTLPFSAFSTNFWLPLMVLLMAALSYWAVCPAGMSPSFCERTFPGMGVKHVGKMGSASRNSSHNSAIHRTKTWAGKSPNSSKHWIITAGDGNVVWCFVFVRGGTSLDCCKAWENGLFRSEEHCTSDNNIAAIESYVVWFFFLTIGVCF